MRLCHIKLEYLALAQLGVPLVVNLVLQSHVDSLVAPTLRICLDDFRPTLLYRVH